MVALEGLKFTSTSTLSATVGSPYSYSVTATNASNPTATITLTAPVAPAWLTLLLTGNGAATLSGTPIAAGANSVTLSANDGTTTVTQPFTINVALAGVGKIETFQNMPASAGSYATRDWVGDNSISWHATQARTDLTINSRAICFEKAGSPFLQSATIPGGISQVSFKHKQMYSTAGGTISLYINGQQVGSPVSVTTTVQTAIFNGFNYNGDIVIKLVSNGITQIGIDDLSWVEATAVSNISPIITNITNLPVSPTTTDDVVISSNITDSDGTIQNAWVKWGAISSNLTDSVTMDLDGSVYKVTIPKKTIAGTIYVSINAKDNLDSVSTVFYDYDVVQNEKPTISNIANNPSNPVTGQTIKITSTITDSDGLIEDAWVKWGTSASSLNNQVTMALTGENYEALIPAQTQVGTIYLSINARDDLGGISTSLYSFAIAQANLFPVIANVVTTPQNPLTGQAVKVTATITDSDGTIKEALVMWGLSSSNLTNPITLDFANGNYEATIPAQSQAGTIYFSVNAKDNLDSLTTVLSNYAVAANQHPAITNISKTPLSPLTGQAVTLLANITDSDGTIQQAWVKWGTSALSLDNELAMTLDGDVYKAIIPAQTQSGNIYVSVNAKDNLALVSTELYSYYVAQNQAPIIFNIMNSPQSPTVRQLITISSTITDSDGTVQEAWLDWGTASNNLSNRVGMTFSSNSYTATIPAQIQTGTIYLAITAKDNLLATSTSQYNFTISPITAINNDEENSKVKVYPNPAKNQLYVEVQELKATRITISNIIGETVFSTPSSGNKQPIDISRLKSGVYFVVVIGDGFRSTTRIIVY